MPCSPVTVPPRSIATSMMSAKAACERFLAASSPFGVMSRGCRLPSPAWAALAMNVSCEAAISSTGSSISASRPRGRQTSSTRIASRAAAAAETPNRRAAKSASASSASVDMHRLGGAGRDESRGSPRPERARGLGDVGWQQQRSGVLGQPGVFPLVHRREAMAVDQLEHGGFQPARGHSGDGRAAGGKGVEEADDGTGGGRAGRAEPDRHLGDHTQRALGADHEPDQVVARHAFRGAPPETHDLPGRRDHFQRRARSRA